MIILTSLEDGQEYKIPLNGCTATEIGYNNTFYIAIINPGGYGIKAMYCLDDYSYSYICY